VPNRSGELPDDLKLQREIEKLISAGEAAVPNWVWPMLKPYHGFSGEDRVRGWQITTVAERLGLIPKARQCTVCQTTAGRIERHSEDYSRPLLAEPICRSCHRKFHLRFRYPDQWRRHVQKYGNGTRWFEFLEV
jgi:hypothetical protein